MYRIGSILLLLAMQVALFAQTDGSNTAGKQVAKTHAVSITAEKNAASDFSTFKNDPDFADVVKELSSAEFADIRNNDAALYLYYKCHVGRKLIPEASVKRIHLGTNGKVVILGSSTSRRIQPSAEVLRKEGFNVELFDADCQKTPFVIDGKSYTFEDLDANFKDVAQKYNGWIPYEPTNASIVKDIKSLLFYKANIQFIERILREGYSIVDIGQVNDSYFCDLENEMTKSIKWIE